VLLYAVRHCEKDEGDDPGLTKEGQERAEALAEVMAEVPLAAIYATEYRRTQETVAPTAEAQGLDVSIDIDPEGELAAHLLTTHPGEVVLHAGHSFTLPDLFTALELDEVEGFEGVDGYGQLWIITADAAGGRSVEMSHFGEK